MVEDLYYRNPPAPSGKLYYSMPYNKQTRKYMACTPIENAATALAATAGKYINPVRKEG